MSTADRYVDVSSNNRQGDLSAYAKAGYRKISVKVSEGSGPVHGYHWYGGDDLIARAHALGLAVEGYHWLRPETPAKDQTHFFLSWAGKWFRHGDNLMTDFETSYDYASGQRVPDGGDARRADQLAAFNELVSQELATPNTYTGNWYLAEMGTNCQAECRRWPVVMSNYDPVVTLPNPYGLTYVARQYTDRGRVAGWPDPLDVNRILVPAHIPVPVTPPLPAPPPGKPQAPPEVGSVYELLYDQNTKIWYAWAPGYWRRFTSRDELLWASGSNLCVNGKVARDVILKPTAAKLDWFGVSHAHTTMRRAFALGSQK